jgi:hypothetical protein
MTIAQAVTRARQMLGGAATEDAIANQAVLLMMPTLTPAEEARLLEAARLDEAFEVIVAHASDYTDEQIAAMELTAEQAVRMAAARQRDA